MLNYLFSGNPLDWFELEDTLYEIFTIFKNVLIVGQSKLICLDSFIGFLHTVSFKRRIPIGKLIYDNAE